MLTPNDRFPSLFIGGKMTIPRSEQIDVTATPFYHCYTRCVRRSYLCGSDPLTGIDFSHRREWIVARLKQLTTIFAIKICAYAVMSNHYHLVLFVDLAQAQQWSFEEIYKRWKKLFPKDAKRWQTVEQDLFKQRVELWRERLMSVSWFMRCLNETIACLANKEDGCTGSFWEGRFKSQALLDEGAVLAAMTYVDLNPIHANIAKTPETSDFTSIQERILCLKQQSQKSSDINATPQPEQLMPFKAFLHTLSIPYIDMSLADYLLLVDYTGRAAREDKIGSIPNICEPILTRLKLNPSRWTEMVSGLAQEFSYAIGEEKVLFLFRKRHNRPFKGKKFRKNFYLSAA